ncbi:hypothetical protein PG997_001352 [Apiospora hydei]|uniref:Ankyrin n=1 Tax=Apiospora hydei TaxID=1337664 RepID=A0ABR1XDM0_9PEZI
MASFSILPTELILALARYLNSFEDITAVSATCRSAGHVVGETIMPSLLAMDLGRAYLQWSIVNSCPQAVKRALENGVNPNDPLELCPGIRIPEELESIYRGIWRVIPALHTAAWEGNPTVVRLLIDYGAEIEAQHAIDKKWARWESYDYNYHIRPRLKDTALELAIEYNQIEAVKLNTHSEDNKVVPGTALHFASFIQNLELVKWFVESGYQMDVNALDDSQMCPLAYWSYFGTQPSIGDYLISKGADPNAMVSGCCNLLLEACWHGRFECVLMLLDHGAEVNSPHLFTTALHASCSEHNDRPAVHRSVRYNDRDIPEEHLRVAVVQSATPLLIASRECLAPIVSVLLAAGASVNARDKFGYNALFAALKGWHYAPKKKVETVTLLVDTGFDMGMTTERGSSVLHLLGSGGVPLRSRSRDDHEDSLLLQLLLERGADAKAPCRMLVDYGAGQNLTREELCAMFDYWHYRGHAESEARKEMVLPLQELLLEVYTTNFFPHTSNYLQSKLLLDDIDLVRLLCSGDCEEGFPLFSRRRADLSKPLKGYSNMVREDCKILDESPSSSD